MGLVIIEAQRCRWREHGAQGAVGATVGLGPHTTTAVRPVLTCAETKQQFSPLLFNVYTRQSGIAERCYI